MSQYLDKDGASRIAENFLSKQAEQDTILRNLQFDLKEAEHALVKTIQGPAPLNIRALTRPLDDYVISGNTLQDGTPTPDYPVDVVGCGVRTGNLFNAATVYGSMYDSATGVLVGAASTLTQMRNNFASSMVGVPITITIRADDVPVTRVYIRCTIGGTNIDSNAIANGKTGTMEVTVTPTSVNDDWRITFGTGTGYLTLSDLMLNLGSTPLPYEPYGYKLPLTVNGTEYPIYLGQVETTRRIKKLVLTGEEVTWGQYVNNRARFVVSPRDIRNSLSSGFVISDRYNSTYSVPQLNRNSVENAIAAYEKKIYIYTNGDYDIDAYKSYLAAQYAAGMPVAVWYVLAEPVTAITNEPLHKIGDYADTISFAQAGVEISTTKGFNTITTDTTVLPSNIEVKGVINNA